MNKLSAVNSETSSNNSNNLFYQGGGAAQDQVLEFRFPLRKEQLCDEPADSTRFWVKARKTTLANWKEDQLLQELEQISESISTGGGTKCLGILENDNFDPLYSMLYYLEEMPPSVRKELIHLLQKSLHYLLKLMERDRVLNADAAFEHRKSLQSNATKKGSTSSINVYRNCLKAYIYLITWFMQDYSKLKESALGGNANGTKPRQRKGSNVPPSTSKKGGQQEKEQQATQAINEIKMLQNTILDDLLKILQLDIKFLWYEQKVEEDFVRAFVKTGFDMLESPANTKVGEIKDKLFQILQMTMERYGSEIKYMQSQNSTKIIDLLYNQDNLAPHMAEFVSLVAEKQGSQMPNEIIRELTKQIFHNDSSHETIGIKNVGIFLRKLSKSSPKVVYQNISSLLGFFDCEAYLLRQAIIKILANIIQYVLTVDSGDPHTNQVYNTTKEKFLELLYKRFHDKSAYCRAKVCKVFIKLTEANVVPRHHYFNLLQCVIGRLHDQTTNVRKNALKLFAQMVVIYGLIFSVDLKRGRRFMTKEDINREKTVAQQENDQFKAKFDQIQEKEKRLRGQIIHQRGIEDQAQLVAVLGEYPEYQSIMREAKEVNELVDQTKYVLESLIEYQGFLDIISQAVQFLAQLLSSKTIQDTIETIKVFRLLYQYGIQDAIIGIKRMLTLVFSKDLSVQQAVFDSYKLIYFESAQTGQQNVQEKTKNLIGLLKDATLTDVTCIEELMKKCVQNDIFEREVYNTLWRAYTHPNKQLVQQAQINREQFSKQREQDKEEQRAAIQLLRMIGSSKIEVLLNQKENLYEYSLKYAKFDRPDFMLLKEALLAYEKLIHHSIQSQKNPESQTITEQDKKYIFSLLNVVINTFGTDDTEWFCATETILNTLFNVKTRNSPEYASHILKELAKKLYSSDSRKPQQQPLVGTQDEEGVLLSQSQQDDEGAGNPLRTDIKDIHYAQLFFVAGHVAIKMLSYIEQLESDMKKQGSNAANEAMAKQANKGRKDDTGEGDKGEDELDQIAGGKEAEIEQMSQMLHKVTEESLIQTGVLGKFLPPLVKIAQISAQKYSSPEVAQAAPHGCVLERSAILALCKFMCVSSQVCAQNLDLLFALLRSHIDFGVKANIIIAVGDLFNRFPNVLFEKTKDIFQLLHDPQSHVRRQALMVITHLVLNDMLKLKGEIVDICMLLEDEEDKIKDQVKLFLHELHSKSNHMIYNLFPKAISRLSKEFIHLSKEKFENIAKNLLTYIDKDRQTEQLIDKLCQKLKLAQSQVEWRNTAFCLSQMKYTEKIFIRLIEYYESCYKERLASSSEVREYFLVIVQQVKKFTKPEIKKMVDDFELKITSAGQILAIGEDGKTSYVSGDPNNPTSLRRSTTQGMANDQAAEQLRKSGSLPMGMTTAQISSSKKRSRQEITKDDYQQQRPSDLQRNIAQAQKGGAGQLQPNPFQPQMQSLLTNPQTSSAAAAYTNFMQQQQQQAQMQQLLNAAGGGLQNLGAAKKAPPQKGKATYEDDEEDDDEEMYGDEMELEDDEQ